MVQFDHEHFLCTMTVYFIMIISHVPCSEGFPPGAAAWPPVSVVLEEPWTSWGRQEVELFPPASSAPLTPVRREKTGRVRAALSHPLRCSTLWSCGWHVRIMSCVCAGFPVLCGLGLVLACWTTTNIMSPCLVKRRVSVVLTVSAVLSDRYTCRLTLQTQKGGKHLLYTASLTVNTTYF